MGRPGATLRRRWSVHHPEQDVWTVSSPPARLRGLLLPNPEPGCEQEKRADRPNRRGILGKPDHQHFEDKRDKERKAVAAWRGRGNGEMGLDPGAGDIRGMSGVPWASVALIALVSSVWKMPRGFMRSPSGSGDRHYPCSPSIIPNIQKLDSAKWGGHFPSPTPGTQQAGDGGSPGHHRSQLCLN